MVVGLVLYFQLALVVVLRLEDNKLERRPCGAYACTKNLCTRLVVVSEATSVVIVTHLSSRTVKPIPLENEAVAMHAMGLECIIRFFV